MLSLEERTHLIQKISALPKTLAGAVNGLSKAQLQTRFIETEWTVAQIVHHIADSHMNSYVRTKLMLTEAHPTLRPYNQEAWAKTPEIAPTPIEASLTILRGLHRRWDSLFENMSDEDWQRTGHHPEIGDITFDDILTIYARHGEEHLEQIQRVLAAQAG
jgi:hypothetical protein